MVRDRLLQIALALSLSAPAAWAAPPRPARPAPPGPQEVEDLRETVHIIMISRLKRELRLTDQQQEQVVPLLDELEQSRRRVREENRRSVMEIRRLLQAEPPPERELGEQVRAVREMRRGFEADRARIEAEISRVLTPLQQAQMLVFLQDFRRDLRSRLEGLRLPPGRMRTSPTSPHPGAPLPPEDDPEDDDL